MRVSVVIPAFNETGNIGRLVEETFDVVPGEILAEVIVVDDASDDGTGDELGKLLTRFPALRVLRHDVRAGQSAALRTGVRAARSEVIATMDGDGQNDPADIPPMLAQLAPPQTAGVALVGGIRAKRQATGSRRFASRFANWVRDRVLRDDCPDTGCGVKVFWRQAFIDLPYFSTMHRYLPALFQSYGHEVAYIPVNDRPRLAGTSKYTNLGRALIGIYDLVGVSWLRKRTILPPVREAGRADTGGTTAARQAGPTSRSLSADGVEG